MTEETTRTTPKTVLITGASSGIGAATAARLARNGHNVVLGARRTDRLEELVTRLRGSGGNADAVRVDVTEAGSVRRAVEHAVERHGRLDVLVNNAGVMPLSALAETRVEEWDWMIDVNIRGVLYGIAAAHPVMSAQGAGHIITVASTGAHEVVPTAAVYCATKYAAWAISEGLRIESDPSLRVTTITPGVTESELAETISDPRARAAMREYRTNAIPASAVADAVGYAVDADPGVDVNEIIVRPVGQRP
jgi:NADP-dependent 3-hydroxy acid dehydrogenase YdfG